MAQMMSDAAHRIATSYNK